MAEYPIPKFHFRVDWGGTKIDFTEVTGMEVTTEKIEFRHGASREYNKMSMPGMRTFSEITLKRGTFARDNEFYDWWNSTSLNQVERRDISISLLNEEHEPVITWNVKQAYPTKVTSTDLNSTGNEMAVETLVLAHEGLTIQNE